MYILGGQHRINIDENLILNKLMCEILTLTLSAATLISSCSPPLSLSSDRAPPTSSARCERRSSCFSWLTAAS